LWFDGEAEEAMIFYTSVFKNSSIISISRYPEGPMQGKVLTGEFELDGQRFMALDGGPEFKFNESVSSFVTCESQEEVETYWEKLTAGGEEEPCG
jgi:predicted 3-demethylubiquinone-9 3-methyltransferase (glyoxalase superfamily)